MSLSLDNDHASSPFDISANDSILDTGAVSINLQEGVFNNLPDAAKCGCSFSCSNLASPLTTTISPSICSRTFANAKEEWSNKSHIRWWTFLPLLSPTEDDHPGEDSAAHTSCFGTQFGNEDSDLTGAISSRYSP